MTQINVRQIVLDTIAKKSNNGTDYFRADDAMKAIRGKVKSRALDTEVLTHWSELLRGGIIALGNPDGTRNSCQDAGVYFVTDAGEKTLTHASRDPINQAGYMAYLDKEAALDTITRGYVEEALNTYRACCYKATAVMIGAAVENLVLDLRDELLDRWRATTIPKGMDAWQVKTALEAMAEKLVGDLKTEVKRHRKDDALRQLYEDAEAKLFPTAAEFRKTRNSAGHPASLDPVHPADVHCNLLLFPATAKLILNLKKWAIVFYV